MSQKALDTFFRNKLLVLLPLLLLVVAASAYALTRESGEYQSQAKIWVQRTPLLTSQLGNDSTFSTPAGSQARVLNDLLSLESFREDVATRVPQLEGSSPAARTSAVREGTSVFSSGNHILVIQNKGSDAATSQAIVAAIIDTYSDRFSANVVAEADSAASFYEARLTTSRGELEGAKAELLNYQQVQNVDPDAAAVTNDPELSSLMAEVERAQSDYDDLFDRLQQVYLQRDAAIEGRDLSFQVMDDPSLPSAAIPLAKRDLAMYPIVAGLLGIVASAGVLFALVRMDNSVRLPSEATRSGVPVLAVVPDLGRNRDRAWPQTFVRQVVAISRGLVSG
jgi:uncharacterized protein involved in exopolysaccharide biosynthesis